MRENITFLITIIFLIILVWIKKNDYENRNEL